ncbi:unnamed protein product [Ceratitis capitata]|uniref:(Mediterranean fruit fly) hypothetical protein n=1 Tax=Ceratitis capitata TaxID=7213 RepID=A0A811V0I3_CERCA|nr:unnamed protein product [Ceratitis capitata]
MAVVVAEHSTDYCVWLNGYDDRLSVYGKFLTFSVLSREAFIKIEMAENFNQRLGNISILQQKYKFYPPSSNPVNYLEKNLSWMEHIESRPGKSFQFGVSTAVYNCIRALIWSGTGAA